MARTEARMKCEIWDDEDYRSLTMEAQWLYQAILTQKDLSMCGVLTWTPKRFAKLASNLRAAETRKALELLRSKRYVVVDEDTDELFVRTFITNDRVLDNANSIVGMSRAFGAIHSQLIRRVLVEGLGKGFVEGLPQRLPKVFPKGLPQGFVERLAEPLTHALALASAGAPPHAHAPPASCLLPPASHTPSSSSVGNHQSDLPPASDDEEEDSQGSKIHEAAKRIAHRRLQRTPVSVGNPGAWLAKTADSVEADVLRLLATDPALAVEALVVALDPDPKPPAAKPPDPMATTASAEHARQLAKPCADCGSRNGMRLNDAGDAEACPTCNPSAPSAVGRVDFKVAT